MPEMQELRHWLHPPTHPPHPRPVTGEEASGPSGGVVCPHHARARGGMAPAVGSCALTTHAEVGPTGALDLLAFLDLAPVHAPVALGHLLDDQLALGARA